MITLDKQIKSIGVFRALKLGDMLCTVPALRALRKAYPDASITLIGMPWAESFVERFSDYLDDFIPFPGYPGLPEQDFDPKSVVSFLEKMQQKKFDLLLQMHGKGGVVNPLVSLLGAKQLAGFYPSEYPQLRPDKNTFLPYPDHVHEIRRWLALLKFLKIPEQGEALEFPLSASDEKQFALLQKACGLGTYQYVCLHPGGISGERLSEDQFATVGDFLSEKGFQIVLTGSLFEQSIIKKVAAIMKSKSIDLSGKTDLGTLGMVIKNSAMLIANDTGVSHIASALQTPSVILFQSSDPERWAPLDRELHKVILSKDKGSEVVLKEIQTFLFSSLRAKRDNLNNGEIASSSTNVVSSQ